MVDPRHDYPTDLDPRVEALVTEVIGQDMANDVSHIVRLTAGTGGGTSEQSLITNERMFHEHALALGAAYAVKHGISALLWVKDLRYAWV